VRLHPEAERIVEALGLTPHPEGGFYRETFRARVAVPAHGGARAASTAIYFLLPAGSFSALHRVASDEVWHHYAGDAIALTTLGDDGALSVTRLGGDLAAGERPQSVVRAGVWQAAEPLGARYALAGCTVAPGFDFMDFEMPGRDALLARFPSHAELVTRLTRLR